MISVVIRSKNQAKSLEFLLKNLKERYCDDIEEIIVIDNNSSDNSEEVCLKYSVRFETIIEFSYGGSANLAAELAKNDIVVLFSAHSYPVSPEFFKVIKSKFYANENLAGLRCLHSSNDFRNYINNISALQDPNKSGLIFSGSAFSRKVWQHISFNEEVPTFEDKDWTLRVLKAGYDIEFAPVVFNYEIRRSPSQMFFRFKNDLLGNYQIWHIEPNLFSAFKGLVMSIFLGIKSFVVNIYFSIRRFLYVVKFKLNKPKQFKY